MKHFALHQFWSHYRQLPKQVQQAADQKFAFLKNNPNHPSLQWKPVGKFWSVRVTLDYRALAVKKPEGYYWFWIGSHAEYDRLLVQ